MDKKPWSKLQRELYKLISDDIDFQIHCVAYRMDSQYGNTHLPRYWITLNKEIIWDYPKQFSAEDESIQNMNGFKEPYPYEGGVSYISELIREYIDTSKDEIFKFFENDHWGLIDILRVADRRVGRRRLDALKKETHNIAAHKVIEARAGTIE